MNQLPNNINSERRKFLKVLLIGGGGFLLGRLLRPVAKIFSGHSFEVNSSSAQTGPPDGEADEAGLELPVASQEQAGGRGATIPPEADLGGETDFKNFKVIEKKDSMIFIDKKANEEILILDWGAVDTDKDK